MDRKAASFLALGLLLGIFVTTAAFAWYVRGARIHASSGHARVLKLAHALDQNHPVHRGMQFMADRLDELSGGAMSIEIFADGVLGGETECIEQLQRGALAMTKTSTAPLESFNSKYVLFGVPYIFRDEEHYWTVLEGPIGQELLLAAEDNGLRGLCYYDAGDRSFYTVSKPILTPDDLRGMKIRVQQSKMAMDMVAALGGSPTPIVWGELYTALQLGTVDGAENNLPSFYSSRHFEVCRHFSLNRHTQVPDILLIATKAWDSLTPQQQQWLGQAAEESAQYQRKLWAEETEKARAAVVARGVTIHEPDRQPFLDRVAALHESYRGTVLGELIERVKEVAP